MRVVAGDGRQVAPAAVAVELAEVTARALGEPGEARGVLALAARAGGQPGVEVGVVAGADGRLEEGAGAGPVALAVLGEQAVDVGPVALQHVADGEVAPAVGPVLVAVVGVEEVAQPVGVPGGLLDGLGVHDLEVGVGDDLGESLGPPHHGGGVGQLELAVHIEAGVEVVGVLVVEVPDLERGDVPGLLVGDEPRPVAGPGRVALQVHAAVVGGVVEHHRGERLVLVRVVEDDDIDGAVEVVRDRAVVPRHGVEVGVLAVQAGAGVVQLGPGHGLGEDADARAALLDVGQVGVLEALRVLAGAVGGAVRLVVAAHADRGRRTLVPGGAGDLELRGERLEVRPRPGPELGVEHEPAQLLDGVGEHRVVGAAGVHQGPVGEGGHRVDQGRVGLERLAELRVLAPDTPEEHQERRVERPQQVVLVPHATVVGGEQALDDRQVGERLSGDVGQRGGVHQRAGVLGRGVQRVRVGEERLHTLVDRGREPVVASDHVFVDPLHGVAGLQVVHQLLDGAAVVALVGDGGLADGVGDREHLGLTEGRGRVAGFDPEQVVDAAHVHGLDEPDQFRAGPPEVGRVARHGLARVLGGHLTGGHAPTGRLGRRLLDAPGGEVVAGPVVGRGGGLVVLGGHCVGAVRPRDQLHSGRREFVGGNRAGPCRAPGGRGYGAGRRGDGCGLPEWGEQADCQDQGERER